MKTMFKFASAITATLLLAACGDPPKEPKETIHKNVVRIFMHERCRYSLMVVDPDGKTMRLQDLDFTYTGLSPSFVADVPPREPMWVSLVTEGDKKIAVTFHVHSPESIDGGGWNHGKFGSGQTVPIR